ncbi:MAG: helix-turn-helix domain-containing protein [Spirochaetales bacterium]|nr:helix-turn-helix domain-containing protein [Spirochaetales bacterium]
MARMEDVKTKLVDFSGGGVRFTGHSHRFEYEMILVLEGAIGLQLDRKRHFHLGEGDFVLIPPGSFHWMWCEEVPGRYFNYLFQGDLELFREVSRAGPFSLAPLSAHLGILREKVYSLEKRYGILEGEFYFLWTAGLMQRIGRHRLHEKPLDDRIKGGFEDIIRRIFADMIEENPGVRLSSGELSSAVGLERSYLSRRVKLFTGKTLMEIYYEELFEQASCFLSRGASVKEGAYRFGFADPYHFSRKFKQIRGISPSRLGEQKKEPP